MTSEFSTTTVLAQLEHALGSEQLPPQIQQTGLRLLTRLKSPVRIALLGLPASGKSLLLNALAGQRIVPDGISLPSLEVEMGPKAKAIVMSGGKVIDTIEGLSLNHPVPSGADFIRFEVPNRILKDLCFFEVSLAGSPEEQRKAVNWAQERADIALWCTEAFNPRESELWSSVRDELKDNSFMVLTKADELSVQKDLSVRISLLEDIVAEEFYCLYAIGSSRAMSAVQPDGTKDEELWMASGARSLWSTIMQRVNSGRIADRDRALLFLKQNNVPLSSEPVNAKVGDSSREELDPEIRNEFLTRALKILQTRAADLEISVNYFGSDSSVEILDHCLAVTNEIADLIFAEGDDQIEAFELYDNFMEVSDMLVLMQLEKNSAAAADAVTLLLQLQKEMTTSLAA